MLMKMKWESLQERRARNRVLMLNLICNDLVDIPAAQYLQPVPICTRGFKTKYMQIECNTNTYSQSFFPHTISLWNTVPVDVCQLSTDGFKARLSSIQFCPRPCFYHTAQALFLFCSSSLLHSFHGTNSSLLAVRHCSVTELAPLLEDEDEMKMLVKSQYSCHYVSITTTDASV